MVPPLTPEQKKWLQGMPAHVIRITFNGGGLYSMQINCRSCNKTSQLKQRTSRTLPTVDLVLACLRDKAIDEHAMCMRYNSPAPSVLGTKRAGSPTLTSDSVRSPPRFASARAVLSFNGGVTEVESLERRLAHERAQSSFSAKEIADAHIRQIADIREKNARQLFDAREQNARLVALLDDSRDKNEYDLAEFAKKNARDLALIERRAYVYETQKKLIASRTKERDDSRDAHATLTTDHAKLVLLHEALSSRFDDFVASARKSDRARSGHEANRDTALRQGYGVSTSWNDDRNKDGTLKTTSKTSKWRAMKALKDFIQTVSNNNESNRDALLIGLLDDNTIAGDDGLKFVSPSTRRAVETDRHIVDNARRRLAILKCCRSDEQRIDYHVGLTLLAALPVESPGDQTGMNRRVSTRLAVPFGSMGYVYNQSSLRAQQIEATTAVPASTPFAVGHEISCRAGDGVVLAIDATSGAITIQLQYGEVTYAEQGQGRGGGRLQRRLVLFHPPKRLSGNHLPGEVVKDWHALLVARCPQSPKNRDGTMRKCIGPHQYITETKMNRYESWDELYAAFQAEYPVSAAKLDTKDMKRCPSSLIACAQWNIVKGCEASCLCGTCENHALHMKASQAAADIIGDILTPDDSDEASNGVSDTHDQHLLEELKHVLSADRKYDMVLCVTCGDSTNGSSLLSREPGCIDGKCDKCGFQRLWSDGIRPTLFDVSANMSRGGVVDDDSDDGDDADDPGGSNAAAESSLKLRPGVSVKWLTQVSWEEYRQVLVDDSRTGDDGDGSHSVDGKRKELTIVCCKGTVIEFLDALERVLSKVVPHRMIVDASRRADLDFYRNVRPGVLKRDVDYAQNGEIGAARQAQSLH